MSVIPFDPEHPFPIRQRRDDPGLRADLARVRLVESALALALQENARNRERARLAETRVEELTADLMRAQLAEDRNERLPRAG